MNCYYHPNNEAVKVCSVCNKPICMDCCDTLLGETMCKSCKYKVANRTVRILRDKAIKSQSEKRKMAYAFPVIVFILGVFYLLIDFALDLDSFYIIRIFSLVFIGSGLIIFLVTYKARKKEKFIKEDKPTLKKKFGWICLICAVLAWLVCSAASFRFNMSGTFIFVTIILSLILLIIGLKLSKW